MNKKNQNIQRMEMINFFYHHFVMNFAIKQTKKFFISKKTFNAYQSQIIHFALENIDSIITLIGQNLNNKWSFQEISHLEKSIFIIAISEYYQGQLAKRIVIAEAIKMIKKYNEGAYAYINRVLENILNANNIKLFKLEQTNRAKKTTTK